MESERRYISDEQLKNIKEACKKLFEESRRLNKSEQQQDLYLDELIEDFVKKAFKKVLDENDDNIENIDNYNLFQGFLKENKAYMETWKEEFKQDLVYKKRSWWKTWKW